MEPIDPLHHAEHNKSHNQKIQNCLDKIPVCDRCRSYTDAQIRKRILLYKYSKAPAHIYRNRSFRNKMLMYGKEASNRKQEIDRQHYTIPNQRPKDKHCGKI